MLKGKVKWYNATKGFGFIESENKGDVFVHRTGLNKPGTILETGQTVTFEIQENPKGNIAVKVEVVRD